MDSNNIEELRQRIEKAKSSTDRALLKIKLGEALEEKGEYKEAIKVYKELLRIKDPPFLRTKVLLGIGRAYEELSQHEKALKWYKEVLSDGQVDQDRLSSAEAAISVGEIEYDVKHDIDEGLKYFKVAEAEMESHKDLLDKDTQSYLLGRISVAYSDKEEYMKAIEYAKRCIVLDKELHHKGDCFYSSYHLLGKCYYYLGDYRKAIEALKKIVEEYKEYSYILEVYGYLANSYWSIRDYGNCAKHLEQVFGLGETNAIFEYALGVSYHQLGLYHKAKPHLQRFLQMEPEDEEQIEHAKRILSGKE